jgi:hypothetical protein
MADKQIEKIHLDDGRVAERHTTINEQGDEVVEMFVEPKKTLNLDKRIVNKHKQVLAEQIIETIQDGQVIDRKVVSSDPTPKMQLVDHIAVSGGDINPNQYLTAQQVGPIVTDAVVAGVQAILENQASYAPSQTVSAQSVVEERVLSQTSSNKNLWIGVAVVALLVQFAVCAYIAYVNFGG